MEKIILTTQDELEALIQDSVRKALEDRQEEERPPKDSILSVEQASMFLNLAKQTIYGFTSANKIPFFKKGKKLYFKKSDLEAWLLEERQPTMEETLQVAIKLTNKVNRKGQKNSVNRR